jgi:hypothetical protein
MRIKKYFEFFNQPEYKDGPIKERRYDDEWIKFIDSKEWMEEYQKEELKTDEEILDLWNSMHVYSKGIKDLVGLFSPYSIEHYNKIIDSLDQDSYIKTFYKDTEDFKNVLRRLEKYTKGSDVGYVMSEILGYCSIPALRYMSEDCMKHILSNKKLIRNFQDLWRLPSNMSSSDNSNSHCELEDKKNWWENYLVKPLIPTSDKEQEERIVEIILDSYN